MKRSPSFPFPLLFSGLNIVTTPNINTHSLTTQHSSFNMLMNSSFYTIQCNQWQTGSYGGRVSGTMAMSLAQFHTIRSIRLQWFTPVARTLFQWLRIAFPVIAVGIYHVLIAETLHCVFLLSRQWYCVVVIRLGLVTGRGVINWIYSASIEYEIGEFRNVWWEFIIDFVSATGCSPIRTIPNGCIKWHWFGWKCTSHWWFIPNNLPNWNAINVKSATLYERTIN